MTSLALSRWSGFVLSIKVIALLNAVMLPDKIPVTNLGGWLQFSEFLNVFYSSRTEYFWRSIPAFLLEQNVYFIFFQV
jgi:hypothetical protein